MFTDKSFHFEQQLEQIRNPQECTRKVVQGKSAEIPFTLKVFYDTTRDVKLEFKQQGTSFPIRQTTNQVMTFYTEETDQYEIHVEINYDDIKPRQVYIEYLSGNEIVQSEQEKFDGRKFCMTLFVNTVEPVPIPTKEEIFGESLDYIAQIPAMVTAFNANTQTNASSIAYMWLLLLAVLVLSILTLINSFTSKRGFDSGKKDFEDSIGEVNKMTMTMDELIRNVKKPLKEIKDDLSRILEIPEIRDNVPAKESPLKKLTNYISLKKKKSREEERHEKALEIAHKYAKVKPKSKPKVEPEVQQEVEPEVELSSDSVSEEIRKELEVTPEDIAEERKQMDSEPSGGFIIEDLEEEKEPEKEKILTPRPRLKENNPMQLQPKVFNMIMKEIDFDKNEFKEGAIDKFTYTELNESFACISDYMKWVIDEDIQVPEEIKIKQMITQEVIYHAIYQKIDERNKI